MAKRPGGHLVVGIRDPSPATERRWNAEHRREQAAARAAVLIGDWLDGKGDRAAIERAYRELQDALS